MQFVDADQVCPFAEDPVLLQEVHLEHPYYH